ncbi:MAG: FAD:protein FMN transferase [Gammaproteobacteria bacterium]|nr:FAD:protein FMN transferase [Gammaproteobacteria bacterium]
MSFFIRLFTLLLVIGLSGCGRPASDYKAQFLAFGTLVDLTISGVSKKQAESAAEVIEQDFQRMHRSWHAWDPGPLGRVNRLLETGGTFSVPPSVLPLIQLGKKLATESDNLFNPAIGRLIDAWGFHSSDPEGHQPPDRAALDKLLAANPQMSNLNLNGLQLSSNNPMVKLDFGAFGKGHGIDLAIEHLRELGIDNAIINTGGDLRAIGDHNGKPWRIAIRHPSGEGVIAALEVAGDESVFTSGDYERKFEYKGKQYHHIIDPRSGLPAQGTRSVTVLHSDAATADAAATALFVAGPERWDEIARRMGIRYAMLIDQQGVIHLNPAMHKRLQWFEQDLKFKLSAPLEQDSGNLSK